MTFIEKLSSNCMDHVCNDEQSKKIEKMLEVFAIYGQYLNDILPNYHFTIAQELSHEIFTYSLELTTFCNHESQLSHIDSSKNTN